MFRIFKKNIEKEFWKKMQQGATSYDFVCNYKPFYDSLADYEKHKKILYNNKKWFVENIDKIQKFLPKEKFEILKVTIINNPNF